MIENLNKLLSASELRRLRTGSYESWIEEVRGVVRALVSGDQFEVVATRKDGAVIYTDGKFLRLELCESGPVLSDLDVELFEERSPTLAQREAVAVADLFLRGAMRKAVTRLEGAVSVVRATTDAVALIESQIVSPRLWKRQFDARKGHIIRFLGDRAAGLEEAQLRWNFGKLYDGSVEEGKLVEHQGRVAEALADVMGRLGQIRDEVGSSLVMVSDALAESAGTIADTFACFADDLYGDLSTLHEATSHVIETVDDTRSHGRLCDMLVAGLHDREVAGCFVVVVAERMVEAS